MDIAELGLVIRSDGVVIAKNRLRDFENQADKTEKRAAAMGAVVGRVFAVMSAALSVRELIGYADAWSDMQSRIGAAIKDMDAAPAMMQRMVDLANASYSPLNQTVEIFSRNVGVLRDLGYSANQAADFTEALNHALVVTATRGERAASVQGALAKAMAVGKLQADGLETVLANGGRVAEALAAELDTTVSGLRAMSSQGLITGDVIARALTERLGELRDEAAKMPATITDAFTRVQTNLTALIGTFDKTVGASAAVAAAIIAFADNLDLMVPVIGGVATAMTISMIPAIASATVSFGALTLALLANPFVQVALVVGTLAAALIHLNQQQSLAAQVAQTHAETLVTNANAIETAKTSSQGFRDALRSQIDTQLAAAEAALAEATAQREATAARAQWADLFGTAMSSLSQGLYGESRDVNYGDDMMAKYEASLAAAAQRVKDLRGQLGTLGEVETNYKPIEHTVAGIAGVGTAAAAANDNVKALARDGFGQLTKNANTFGEAARSAFSNLGSGIIGAFKKGGDVAQNVLSMLMDKVGQLGESLLNNGLNGLLDMGLNAIMGAIGGFGMGSGMLGTSSITGSSGGFFPGFATGGSFTVGGSGGTDSQLRAMRLTPGEEVSIRRPDQIAANGNGSNNNPIIINNTFQAMPGATEADGAALARGVTKELKRQLPEAMKAVQRNDLRRAS